MDEITVNRMNTVRHIITFVCLFGALISHAQQSIFANGEAIRDYLDGRIYRVNGYGIIAFSYNRRATEERKESYGRRNAGDEREEVIFDVIVKRDNVRRKDKTDYQVRCTVDLYDADDPFADPNRGHVLAFTLAREVIFPIQNFPSSYLLFADGDLYYTIPKYRRLTVGEYKEEVLRKRETGSGFIGYEGLEYVRCEPVVR
jgi:hypothetical protein